MPAVARVRRRPASVRRVLGAAALASALVLPGASAASAAAATSAASVAFAEECKPDDQECLDKETNANEAKEIAAEKKKTKESAAQADKDIEEIGKDLEKCKPGSSGADTCMSGLAKGNNGEQKGMDDMTAAVNGFKPETTSSAAEVGSATCHDFPASLPAGSADPGLSPFPVSQLCALLGS
ncbi:hypothetical protein ACIRSU_30110 [Streptomyces sp. NPDC101160]|uniref:hypothetical protein n=1 Tax=Streptomyces sp. NPDC101160 TaxID=3366118 RepID=UPI003806FD4B